MMASTTPEVHHNLHRDELAFAMLCAFNGITPEQAPAGFRSFANPAMARAWRRVADAARAHLDARVAELDEALVDVTASLVAAISLLERGGKAAKKAAPSDRMFDQMLVDYQASVDRARAVFSATARRETEGGDDGR